MYGNRDQEFHRKNYLDIFIIKLGNDNYLNICYYLCKLMLSCCQKVQSNTKEKETNVC